MGRRSSMRFAYGPESIGKMHGETVRHAFRLWTRVHRQKAWGDGPPCVSPMDRVHRQNAYAWETVRHVFRLWTRVHRQNACKMHGETVHHAFRLWTLVHRQNAWGDGPPCFSPMDPSP